MKRKSQNKQKNGDYSLAHVLYQKLGNDWYAFTEVDGDCFMTKVNEDEAAAARMQADILAAKEAGDSLGGTVDVRIEGLPVGLGEPVFGKLKAQLASAVGSVNAVSGVTWGAPDFVDSVALPGSAFHARRDVYGGIQGGLSSGEAGFQPVGTTSTWPMRPSAMRWQTPSTSASSATANGCACM